MKSFISSICLSVPYHELWKCKVDIIFHVNEVEEKHVYIHIDISLHVSYGNKKKKDKVYVCV
jgi:hypothetical protein